MPVTKLKRLYNRLNKELFNNVLPPDTKVEWSSKVPKDSVGIQYDDQPPTILISKEIKKFKRYATAVMIHEMAHLATTMWFGLGAKDHGREWHAVMKCLMINGAFDELL